METKTNTEEKSQCLWVEDVWEPPMPPTDLIFDDDGEPLESNRHRIAMNTLIRSLQQVWCDHNIHNIKISCQS